MSGFGAAYAASREHVGELISSLEPESLEVTVPACPEWSVKDLLAHVVGIARDMTTGNVTNVGTSDWTGAHIEAGRILSPQELLAEWKELSAQVEGALDVMHPGVGGLTVADLVTHEHDLRGAIDRPGARDLDTLRVALDSFVRRFGRRLKDSGLPAAELVAGDARWVAGAGEPQARVEGEAFELFRGLGGRRTKAEIETLGWTGDGEIFVQNFSNYGEPEQPLGE